MSLRLMEWNIRFTQRLPASVELVLECKGEIAAVKAFSCDGDSGRTLADADARLAVENVVGVESE